MPELRPPRPILALVPTILAVVLLAFAAQWFVARWQTVMAGAERPDVAWGWLGAAALLLFAHAATAMVIWRQVLRAVGARLTWNEAVDSFAPSLLARYVPGKVWANAVRLGLAKRAGVRLGASAGAIVWETLVALGSAGVVAMFGLHDFGDPSFERAAMMLVFGVIAAWLVAGLLSRQAKGAAFLRRFGGTDAVRNPTALVPSFGMSFIGWMLFGGAHFAIALSVAPLGADAFILIAGAVALAWAGGYLAIVMPLGLGVRDGLLLVLLAPLLTPPQALLLVALSRLVQLAVDASITLGWLLRQAMNRTTAEHPPSA